MPKEKKSIPNELIEAKEDAYTSVRIKPSLSDAARSKKRSMREDIIFAYHKVFFERGVDLGMIQNDQHQSPMIRGLVKQALVFIETGDIKILETMSKIAGLRLGEVHDDAGANALKDFLIDTLARSKKLNDKEEREIIDVN